MQLNKIWKKACFTAAEENAIVQQMKMARLRLFILLVVVRLGWEGA